VTAETRRRHATPEQSEECLYFFALLTRGYAGWLLRMRCDRFEPVRILEVPS
jgi:hypothetical protein